MLATTSRQFAMVMQRARSRLPRRWKLRRSLRCLASFLNAFKSISEQGWQTPHNQPCQSASPSTSKNFDHFRSSLPHSRARQQLNLFFGASSAPLDPSESSSFSLTLKTSLASSGFSFRASFACCTKVHGRKSGSFLSVIPPAPLDDALPPAPATFCPPSVPW